MGFWDQFDDDEEVGEETEADQEEAEGDPDDDSEEDAAFNDAVEAAEAVKDGDWFAKDQLAACLAVAEAALLSKQEKAARRERAEAQRRREEKERRMAEQHERERREVREIIAREEEAKRRAREEGARPREVPPQPTRPPAPSADEVRWRERERQIEADERAAKVRAANAQAAEIEARAELTRAQAKATNVAAAQPAPRVATEALRTERATTSNARKVLTFVPRHVASSTGPAAAGPNPRPPKSGPTPGSASLARDRDPSATVVLAAPTPTPSRPAGPARASHAGAWPAFTGADLAQFRAERRLSQRELAARMEVGHGMVAKAELVPAKALGEGMAAAFARVALPGGATE